MPRLFFLKKVKNFAYDVNGEYEVPEDQAKQFIEDGSARLSKSVLPLDVPARDALLELGVEELSDINAEVLAKLDAADKTAVEKFLASAKKAKK